MKNKILGIAFTLSTSPSTQRSVRLIRSSTLIIHYNGQKILVDPMLSSKGSLQSFAGISDNPTIDLKVPVSEIIDALDFVLVTHIHPDHFDKVASDLLDKSIPLFHQPSDEDYFKSEQFINTKGIVESTVFKGIEIIRVEAQHGSLDFLKYTGKASGFILRAADEPTIYIVGDSIWTEEVRNNIQTYKPEYIIVNSGGASLPSLNSGPIIMDEEQTLRLIKESGNAKVIAVHLEALDHCSTSRASLRKMASQENIVNGKLIIPEDGETILLN